MPAFDFTNPPLRDSSPGAVKRFWSEFADYATPAQRADFEARGIRAPELPKPHHTMTPEFKSESYAQFAAEEAARDKQPSDWFREWLSAGTPALRAEAASGYAQARVTLNPVNGSTLVTASVLDAAQKELNDAARTYRERQKGQHAN